MNKKEIKEYLITKEEEGADKMRKEFDETHKVNSTYYKYYRKILKGCMYHKWR